MFKNYDKYSEYIKKNHNIIVLFIYSTVHHTYNKKKYNSLLIKYKNTSIEFLKLELEKYKEVEKDYFLTGIQCFLFFYKGILIHTINGYNTDVVERYIIELTMPVISNLYSKNSVSNVVDGFLQFC